MRQFLIVGLFAILLADIMLGIGLGLAPGLSLKNALLYVLFVALVLDMTIGDRDLLPEAWGIIIVWVILIGYATFTWLAISLMGVHRGYSMLAGFITLKNQLIDFFLFFLLFLYGPRNRAQTMVLAKWLVVVFILANLLTLIDVFNIPDLGIMDDRNDRRVSGPIGSVNQYGAVLVFLIPLSIGFAVGSAGWTRLFYQIGALIALVLLGLTVSRGAFVGLLAGAGMTFYVVRRQLTSKTVMKALRYSFLALIFVTIAIVLHDYDAFIQRFDFSATTTMRDMSSGRTEMWAKALTMMSYEPITFVFGYGWDAYGTLFLGYDDPHNEYLHFVFNLGFIGLSLWLFIIASVYYQVVSRSFVADPQIRPLLVGFVAGWSAVLVTVFFVGLYLPWLFIWATTGTIVRLSIEASRKQPFVAGDTDADGAADA